MNEASSCGRVAWSLAAILTAASLGTSTVRAQDRACDRLIVDMLDRTVAGIPVDTRADSVAAHLGSDRVERDVEYLEGDPSTMVRISFCGHQMERHWNGLSWEDSSFVTSEGLRVGMPLAAYDSTYGKGRPTWSEAGVVVAYPLGRWEFFAGIDEDCIAPVDAAPPRLKSRACPVRSLWIPLQSPME